MFDIAQEIEIEYKNILTKAEFHYLLTTFPFPEQYQSQTNHYFETEDFQLKKQAAALRIREKDGLYQLTLKEPHPQGLLETHDLLTEQETSSWLQHEIIPKKNVAKQLAQLNIAPSELRYYGQLTTARRELHHNDVLFVLDYSTYHGKSDYEFELEAQSEEAGLREFNALLTEHQITRKKTPSKIERFFATRTP
ncbi:MAG TPA: CYTH domain-containing protein [Virgibacillus sp.]|nr:CYTH domain-containing protein [Virgibacillus sp.]